MPVGKLTRMVVGNTLRSRKHFALSTFGIIIGIATFVLFLASTEQVAGVLEKIFPVEEVEVVAPQASLAGVDMSKKLNDAIVSQIVKRPEVLHAEPRMALAFPAGGNGRFDGQEIGLEIDGSADGVDAGHVLADATLSPDERTRMTELFKDWENPANRGAATTCVPRPRDNSPYKNPCAHPDRYYCDESDNQCHHRVPVVLSPAMLELYNTQFAKSNGTPLVDKDFAQFMIQRGGLNAMRFNLDLGRPGAKQRRVEAVLVGISSKATKLGMTVPIQYIERWNKEFVDDAAGTTYSSVVVTLRDHNQLAVFAQWLRDKLDLRVKDSLGETFSTVVFIIRLVLVGISFIIIVISAINIAHNFFMQVDERRRELGLLRAVGATRGDVQLVVMGEALLVGVIGGLLGIALGVGLAHLIDWLVAGHTPRFPFKPAHWFHFRWWILVGGLACASVFAAIGGYLPARRAAKMAPAQALAQN